MRHYHRRVDGQPQETPGQVGFPLTVCGSVVDYQQTMGSWDDIDCPDCLSRQAAAWGPALERIARCLAAGIEPRPVEGGCRVDASLLLSVMKDARAVLAEIDTARLARRAAGMVVVAST